MIILAVDTAAQSCSAAVSQDDNIISEITLISRKTHSVHLLDIIHNSLRIADMTITDVDGFAVTIGPGSFTGIRIGLSTVKGLCLASKKPVIGISNMDVLAYQFTQTPCLVCIMIDARKNEVYTARYRSENNKTARLTDDQVLPIQKAVEGIQEPCIFAGSGAVLYQNRIRELIGEPAVFPPKDQSIIRASSVSVLAYNRFISGAADDPASLVPQYIRTPDAVVNKII